MAVIIKLPKGGSAAEEQYTFVENWTRLAGMEYSTVAQISEVDMRKLMTLHASSDYLIESAISSPDILDEFTVEPLAMKWIGLRDYVCDGLMADNSCKAKLLASEYWEYILKDHVPVMTSDSAPYGTVNASSLYSGGTYQKYYAFDNNESTSWATNDINTNSWISYSFTNPICIKKTYISVATGGTGTKLKNFKIQASNDNFTSTPVDLYAGIMPQDGVITVDVNNDNYYLNYRLYCVDVYGGAAFIVKTIQFYGRSLDVSVPTMTSNTAPYGEASASKYYTNNEPYKAFDKNSTTYWRAIESTSQTYTLQYTFSRKCMFKHANIMAACASSIFSSHSFNVEYYDYASNSWKMLNTLTCTSTAITSFNIDINAYTDKLRLSCQGQYASSAAGYMSIACVELNFFGVDYSEREFSSGSTMKYLYDHGLEFEDVTGGLTINGFSSTDTSITLTSGEKLEDHLYTNGSTKIYNGFGTNNPVDLSSYNKIRLVAYTSNVAENGFIGTVNTKVVDGAGASYSEISLPAGGVHELDVSQISGNKYIFFSSNLVNTRYMNIYELYLE